MASTTAQIIAGFEGFRSKPYWDVNAYRTGYGSDTITRADGSIIPVAQGMSISQDDALRDLDRRIASEFMPSAQRAVGDRWGSLSPQQQGVLTSLAYNYGAGAWGKGLQPVSQAINSGADAQTIAAQIAALGAHNGGVNARRRAEEASIFAGGQITPVAMPSGQQAPDSLTRAMQGQVPPETMKLFGWDTGATEDDLQGLLSAGQQQEPEAQPMQLAPMQRGQGFVKQQDSLSRALEAFNATRQRRA